MTGDRPLSWPDAARWRGYMSFLGVFFLFFIPVYFGGASFAAWSGRSASPAFDFEASMPFLPWTIIIYQSLFQLFVLPLFQLSRQQLAALTRQSVTVLLCAGDIFLIAPTHLAFQRESAPGLFAPVYEFFHNVDPVYNCAPSLHVAFAALILLACAGQATPRLKYVYYFWLAILAVATLTTHQHHVIDVASGLLLATLVRWLVPLDASAGPTTANEPSARKT